MLIFSRHSGYTYSQAAHVLLGTLSFYHHVSSFFVDIVSHVSLHWSSSEKLVRVTEYPKVYDTIIRIGQQACNRERYHHPAMQEASAWSHPRTYLRCISHRRYISSFQYIASHFSSQLTFFLAYLYKRCLESERHAIRVGRVPVVGIAVVVDIAGVRRVARIG